MQAQQDEYIKSVAGTLAGRSDRPGEAAARQRRDHAGRVRRPEGEGPRLGTARSGCGRGALPPRPHRNCDARQVADTIVIGFDDSEAAGRALDRAIAEATSSGDDLVVVSVFEMMLDPEGPQNFGNLNESAQMIPLVEPPELEPDLREGTSGGRGGGPRGRLRLGRRQPGRQDRRNRPRSRRPPRRAGRAPPRLPRPPVRHRRGRRGRARARRGRRRRRLTWPPSVDRP